MKSADAESHSLPDASFVPRQAEVIEMKVQESTLHRTRNSVKAMRVTLRSVAVLVLVFHVQGYPALAQVGKNTIVLEGHELSLGMPKEAVLSKFAHGFQLLKISGWDEWLVAEKRKADEREVFGSVGFEKGKLVYIKKSWRRRGVDDLDAVIGALAQLAKDGTMPCLLTAKDTDEPDMKSKLVSLRCGPKQLVLSVGLMHDAGKTTKYAEVEELMGTSRLVREPE